MWHVSQLWIWESRVYFFDGELHQYPYLYYLVYDESIPLAPPRHLLSPLPHRLPHPHPHHLHPHRLSLCLKCASLFYQHRHSSSPLRSQSPLCRHIQCLPTLYSAPAVYDPTPLKLPRIPTGYARSLACSFVR